MVVAGGVGVALVLLVLGGLVAVLRGRADLGPVDVPPDAAALGLPDAGPLSADDVRAVRLPLAVRGYRMAEVDQVLARLAEELAVRDARAARAAQPPVPESDEEDPWSASR